MNRAAVLFATLPLALLGCREATQITYDDYPELHLSTSWTNLVEFGEVEFSDDLTRVVMLENLGGLDMGVARIEMQSDGMQDNFYLRFDPEEITCASVSTARSKAKDTGGKDTGGADTGGADTGSADTGSADTGSADTGADDGLGAPPSSTEADPFVLGAGCKMPITVHFQPREVGDIYGSFIVESYTDDTNGEFYRDPHNYKGVTLLHGNGLKGEGQIQVTPRFVDFGHIWTGESENTQIYINNLGDGDLTVLTPEIDPACASEFSLGLSAFSSDGVLAGGTGTLFEVTFTPESTTGSQCTLTITSNDENNTALEVDLQGNLGVDPENNPPTVKVLSPPRGYEHLDASDLELSLYVFDTEQPATSLTCRVKSAVLQQASIATCTPEDDSGYVTVHIPVDDLDEGMDTLLVTVTDQGSLQSQASTTILWMGERSDADDDGDGFGDADADAEIDAYDCDDADDNTYPGAAEIYDGKDNDCDGAIDENTLGYDDDGDSVSELEGDCDDNYEATYPGAPEQADQRDNDCDGLVDEGTANYDGDGDGYSINNGDCDDDDPDRSPAAVEYCDGYDNDCDYLADQADDDGCEPIIFEPMLVGGCLLEDRALSLSESTSATVFVFDPDTDSNDLVFEWHEDIGTLALNHNAINSPYSQTVTWTAPPILQDDTADLFTVYMTVTDDDEQQAWCFEEIAVYAEPIEDAKARSNATEGDSGCGSSDSALLLMPMFGLLALRRRRRDAE